MRKLSYFIVRHRKLIMVVFIILCVLSVIGMTQVKINYSLQDYLPKDVPSTQAIDKLSEEFDMTLPNAQVMVPIDSIQEGLQIKNDLRRSDGVISVLWLDDSVDLAVPIEMADQATVEGFYKDGMALYQVAINTNDAESKLEAIYDLHEDVRVSGNLVDLANAQFSSQHEIGRITLFVIPIALIILLISTHSWLEPFVFAVAIGVGILLNMGTNFFIKEISFITQTIAAVLQLAVSMDYAIFLLNQFNQLRQEGYDAEEAMALGIQKSVTAIASSAMTTVFGFLALIFMRFSLGADLGLVMAKGILFSFISVIIFMPVLLLGVYKFIDKTTHRPFIPDFTFLGRFVIKARWGIIILGAILILPGFLGSRSNKFIYGNIGYPDDSKIFEDRQLINDHFGINQQLSLLVPRGNIPKELELEEKLESVPEIKSVISYVSTVDKAIPTDVVPEDQLSMLMSDNYSNFIITAEMPGEGDKTFRVVEEVRQIAHSVYDENYYLNGLSVVMMDMKTTIEADEKIVNGLAILAIALTIMFAFKSLTLPLILVLTIELAIWINLSVPYFSNIEISYVGYLIISTVQLGATVDYAIFYTDKYLTHRRTMKRKQAILKTSGTVIKSLLPPALILTCTGLVLNMISSLSIVSELGEILARGAVLSFTMVIFLLPCLLYYFDFIIRKTTRGLHLMHDEVLHHRLHHRKRSSKNEATNSLANKPSHTERSNP
ncbi:MAG: efflux RND transporter permease subunit [Fastidiosipilaceae bacterium]|jgi:predicted RND superfamily exporter protein|nr:MMPL family transporter [Clostridiaceae bacterium]